VVYTRISGGEQIPGLENAKETLIDMGLLKNGDDEIARSERTNIPRFLNRLLSLGVARQNALFDYFYRTFQETVEHLRAKGKIDACVEDLKANSVRIAQSPQVLFTDAATGASTIYYKLEIVVPTRPAQFEEISQTGGVYFYEHRSRSEFVAARPSPAHTNPETGMRLQMFSLVRPAGYNLAYISEAELNQKYKIVAKTRARAWWTEEQKKIPPTMRKTIHLLSGTLLPVWKSLKKLQQDRLNIVRTTTDDGKRLVGVNIPGETVGEIRRAFGLWRNTAANAAEILRSLREENETIELLNEMKIRPARFKVGGSSKLRPHLLTKSASSARLPWSTSFKTAAADFFFPKTRLRRVRRSKRF
jgi:hypothetical protein